MASREQMLQALRNAHQSGNQEHARRIAQMIKQLPPEDKSKFEQNKAVGFLNSVGQGLSFGALDEGQAALLAAVGTVLPESMGGLPEGKSFGENYRGIRDVQRERNQEFREEDPVLAYGGEIVGGLVTGGTGLARAGATAVRGANAARVARTGAAMGAVGGLGTTEAELADVDNLELGKAAFDVGLGSGAGLVVGSIGSAISHRLIRRGANEQRVRALVDESRAGPIADRIINQEGRIVVHREAQQAIRQGLPESTVGHIRLAAMDDMNRGNMQQMVQIVRRSLQSSAYRDNHSVSDVVGREALRRFRGIERINNQARTQLARATDGLRGRSVDISQSRTAFFESLEQAGVQRNANGLDFHWSDFARSAKAQRNIEFIARHLQGDNIDARMAHTIKQRIDGLVEYGVGKTSGANLKAENTLKSLRHSLNQSLRGMSREYDIANQKYADTIEVINNIRGLAGKNEVTAGTLGTLMRRATGESISRSRVGNIYASLDEVAERYGVRFHGSVSDLNTFRNDLQSFFPTLSRNSFKSETASATAEAVSDVISNPVGGLIRRGARAIDNMRGVNTDSQLDAIERLLASNTNFEQVL